jgi:hypothetical protein
MWCCGTFTLILFWFKAVRLTKNNKEDYYAIFKKLSSKFTLLCINIDSNLKAVALVDFA